MREFILAPKISRLLTPDRLMLTSIFSAGNTYTYAAVRTLYGLALEGRAPAVLKKCTRNGVPLYCFFVVMIFPILSFVQCGKSASVAIGWFASLVTGGGKCPTSPDTALSMLITYSAGLISYIVMSITYIQFHRACKAQGLDRKTLPYTGWFQPYGAYIALAWMFTVCCIYGYTSYLPWNTSNFFSNYTMQLFIPWLFLIWKVVKKTKWRSPMEVDLVWERPTIDAYEETFTEPPVGFWREMGQLLGIKRIKGGNDQRRPSVVAPMEGLAGHGIDAKHL
jgi:yeast amino acid transporter